MSKKVCIVGGTGHLGQFITNAFLARKNEADITVLTRPESQTNESTKKLCDSFRSRGAKISYVDFNNSNELIKALKGNEVVISALSHNVVAEEQNKLIDAAKMAGVKKFIPSEFGVDTTLSFNQEISLIKPKIDSVKKLEELGLDYTRFMTGIFLDMFFSPWFGFDLPNGKANIIGDGNVKFPFTHREDVGKYVAEAVLSGKSPKVVRLAPIMLSLNDALDLLRKQLGRTIDVKRESVEEVKSKLGAGKISDIGEKTSTMLRLSAALGYAMGQPTNEKDYPSVKPITFNEWLKTMPKLV